MKNFIHETSFKNWDSIFILEIPERKKCPLENRAKLKATTIDSAKRKPNRIGFFTSDFYPENNFIPRSYKCQGAKKETGPIYGTGFKS
jgi:hypothetical protein